MFEHYRKIVVISFVVLCIVFESNGFDAEKDVDFELFTRADPKQFEQLKATDERSIQYDSMFNPSRPTRIFIHGYLSKRKVLNRYAEAYLKAGDYNFFAVNWTKGSSTLLYPRAKLRVRKVSLLRFTCLSSRLIESFTGGESLG